MRTPRSRAGLLAAGAGLKLSLPAGWLVAHLPAGVGLWVGRRIGDLLWGLLARRRQVTLDNLRRSFSAERTSEGLRRLGRRSFQHLGMNLIEACVFFFRPTAVLLSRVHMEGVEHLRAAAAGGRGILLLTAHYGNWELLAASHVLAGLPLSVVVRPLDHPVLDDLAARFRARSGVHLVTKRRALRDILEALRQQRMVGILLDQNAERAESVFVPFFGVPASTSKGLAVISLRSGAPVVPVFIRRETGGRHRVEISAPLAPPADGDIVAYTAEFNRVIEATIRVAPEQWLWMHARWRTRPRQTVP